MKRSEAQETAAPNQQPQDQTFPGNKFSNTFLVDIHTILVHASYMD